MSTLKSATYSLMHYCGFNAVTSRFMTDSLFVIPYHSVSDMKDKNSLAYQLYSHISIDAALFEKHIKILKDKGHTFITPKEIPRAVSEKLYKPTIIYFDDGYKDNLTVALPILKKYNIPATVFVTTGLINRTHMLWSIELRALLTEKNIPVNEHQAIIEKLKTLTDLECKAEILRNYGKISPEGRKRLDNIYMTWGEIKELSQNGIEIGSHGASHSRLSECTDMELINEVKVSKEEIDKNIGGQVVSFSYPHGRWNERVNVAMKQAGYLYITSIGSGVQNINEAIKTPFFLKNLPIKITDSGLEIESKLYGIPFIKKYVN